MKLAVGISCVLAWIFVPTIGRAQFDFEKSPINYGEVAAHDRVAALASAIEKGEIPGPRLLAASPWLTVTGGLGDMRTLEMPGMSSMAITVDGPENFRRMTRELIRAAMRGRFLPDAAHAPYFTALLMSINGWASWCAYERWQARLGTVPGRTDDDDIIELLAIRLGWEWLLLQDPGNTTIATKWIAAHVHIHWLRRQKYILNERFF